MAGPSVLNPRASESLADSLLWLSESDRIATLADLNEAELASLEYDWKFWGRPDQQAPAGDWLTWLLLAGRGFGKTRTGSEWIRTLTEGDSPMMAPKNSAHIIAIVGDIMDDVIGVQVAGPAGILANSRPGWRPKYRKSDKQLVWENGIVAQLYTARDPDKFRGPQHSHAWLDELAKWRYAREAYDNLMMGLRMGDRPQKCITTTPRPIKLLKEIIADSGTLITKGTTYANTLHLPKTFLDFLRRKYEGSRLGRQELNAELLDDIPGALWQRARIDELRRRPDQVPQLRRVVVAVDPAASSGEDADETGIVVAGKGVDGHYYVLNDASLQETPAGWAREAVRQYYAHECDRMIGEVNNGGEMVGATIKAIDPLVPFTPVRASRGKVLRAEPVSTLYEQGFVHHVGSFPQLEDEQCEFTTDFDPDEMGYSPDRVDALVYAITHLMGRGDGAGPKVS